MLRIRGKSERSFMPVLRFSQLPGQAAIDADAPQMAIILTAAHQKENGITARRKSNLLDLVVGVIEEVVVSGLQVDENQIIATGQSMCVSQERSIRRPGGVGG